MTTIDRMNQVHRMLIDEYKDGYKDAEKRTVFAQASEGTTRFQVDLNDHNRHMQRIDDFLAGAGGSIFQEAVDGLYTITLPISARVRWDNWFQSLN